MAPIEKSVSCDCMEGMPERVDAHPPYDIRCCVLNTQRVLSVLVGVRTFPKITEYQFRLLTPFFTAFHYWKLSTDPRPYGTGKPSAPLSAHFVSLPWLIRLKSTEMQNDTLKQSIRTYTCKMTKRQKSHCSLTVHDKGTSFCGKIFNMFQEKGQIILFFMLLTFLLNHIKLKPK